MSDMTPEQERALREDWAEWINAETTDSDGYCTDHIEIIDAYAEGHCAGYQAAIQHERERIATVIEETLANTETSEDVPEWCKEHIRSALYAVDDALKEGRMSNPAFTKTKGEDNRPQRGFWAPGEYLNHCTQCGWGFIGDKRAQHCADCAYGEKEGGENELFPNRKQSGGKAEIRFTAQDMTDSYERGRVASLGTLRTRLKQLPEVMDGSLIFDLLDEVEEKEGGE